MRGLKGCTQLSTRSVSGGIVGLQDGGLEVSAPEGRFLAREVKVMRREAYQCTVPESPEVR